MNGHCTCNLADRLSADMSARPETLPLRVSLLGSWRLPGRLTVCACRRLAPAHDNVHARAKDREIRDDSGKFGSKYQSCHMKYFRQVKSWQLL